MSEMTALDRANTRMMADEEDQTARMAFYARLAECELFLLLEREAEGETITPREFPVEGLSYVLAFDREERLAEFAGGTAPYAALSGRNLARMLAGQKLGVGLNLGVAPSSILIPDAALVWLVETLSEPPTQIEAEPEEFFAPAGLPETLILALDTKLAQAEGLARYAYLVAVRYKGNARSHLLAFIDTLPGAEGALAGAVNEALRFSGLEAGEIDVAFLRASDPSAAQLAKVGLRFDLPETPKAAKAPAPPGSDPDHPPNLR